MTPPSRDQIEQMAFMAMMDGIIHTNVPCSCSTCKSENRSKGGPRPQQTKRTGSGNNENVRPTPRLEPSGTCSHSHNHIHSHNHPIAEPKSSQPGRKPSPPALQNKSSNATPASSARSDKVNALLKADNVQAVFEVFNQTSTSKDEKDLATRIQNATKDCKLYQETRDKILELCDEDDVDLDAVFGLLAKFRYERNMLTTAVIKGNSEREKALLCIQRVDHLMYMLQDVAKKKDSKGNDVMHKLGDIIMEIHDLAKTPSTLYDEFLDIKEEHFDLLNDHEEMHQKFVDVNSCHEKLHSSHDRLQTDHTKLLKDFSEAKKKASTVGGLKNDISRLEKAVDKSNNDNADLKREVERLNAELAKVNALKHENAQLKKKVTTLASQPPPVEEASPVPPAQVGKKKKGKRAPNDTHITPVATPDAVPESESRFAEAEKEHELQIGKLKKAHDTLLQEIDVVRSNLKQIDSVLRKAENNRDQALEKLEVEKATSRNWKDIAKGNLNERDRLQAEVDRHLARAARLQSTVEELEQSLHSTKSELAEQTEAHKQIREELEQRSPTPAISIVSQQTASLSSDTIRLLRKIRSETSQLARDMDDLRPYGGDYVPYDMIQHPIRRVVYEVERDIEEILSVKGNDPPISNHGHMPEAVLPFVYNNLPTRQPLQLSPRPDYSPQESPHVPSSTSVPPYRPVIPPPPGFNEHSTSPFGHGQHPNHGRNIDSPSAPFSRMAEPPGLTANLGFSRTIEPPSIAASRYNGMNLPSSSSLHSHSSLHGNHVPPNPNVGVIGSRSTSSKLTTTPSPISTPAPNVTSGAPGVAASTSATAPGGLGNGAVGVDWNMWARPGR